MLEAVALLIGATAAFAGGIKAGAVEGEALGRRARRRRHDHRPRKRKIGEGEHPVRTRLMPRRWRWWRPRWRRRRRRAAQQAGGDLQERLVHRGDRLHRDRREAPVRHGHGHVPAEAFAGVLTSSFAPTKTVAAKKLQRPHGARKPCPGSRLDHASTKRLGDPLKDRFPYLHLVLETGHAGAALTIEALGCPIFIEEDQ